MPLELGTFIFFNIMAFGIFGYSLNLKFPLAGVFGIIGFVVFMGLALLVLGGPVSITSAEVTEQHFNSTGHNILNVTTPATEQVIISTGYTLLLNYLYMGLGTFSLVLFLQRKWDILERLKI